jgi:hypothetical protein
MKKFNVRVSRTIAQHLVIEIEAENDAEAIDKALNQAGGRDFNDGSTSEPIYDVDEIEELE